MTITDYAARKKRMTALLTSDDIPAVPQSTPVNPPDSPIVLPDNHTQNSSVNQVLLQEIEIDLHQPRQYLPAELRRLFASREINHQDVITQLMTRAANNDMEAEAYLADMRTLANDIKANGQLYAILVYTNKDRDDRQRYHLIDGERRFWAMAYLSSEPDNQVTTIRAEVRADLEQASADDILNLQWSANMQRDSVCAMDIAEFVCAKREEAVRHLEMDPRLLTIWRKGDQTVTPRVTAQRMVCSDLAHAFGRPLKRRAYYQYLSLVEKLVAPVKALARAHKLPLSRLILITSQQEREQMEATLQMIELLRAPEDSVAKSVLPQQRPGRPTRSRSRITLAERAVAGMDSDTEQMLRKWSRDELASVLQTDQDLIEATNRHQSLVRSALDQR